MPKPKTRDELLSAANSQFAKLMALIESMPEDERQAAFCFDADKAGKEAHWQRDKNLRDVLIHLYEWHQLLLIWVDSNVNGNLQPFLPAPYNWKTYGEMNRQLWQKHQSTTYDQAFDLLHQSHQAVLELIEAFSDDDLFMKKRLPWTGTTTLAGYCTSTTSSHYDWAIKKVKLQIKALNAGQ